MYLGGPAGDGVVAAPICHKKGVYKSKNMQHVGRADDSSSSSRMNISVISSARGTVYPPEIPWDTRYLASNSMYYTLAASIGLKRSDIASEGKAIDCASLI